MDESKLRRCLTCNYILNGLDTPQCPECGRAFDPADDRTFISRTSQFRKVDSKLRRAEWIESLLLVLLSFSLLFWLTGSEPESATTKGMKQVLLWSVTLLYLMFLFQVYTAALELVNHGYALWRVILAVALTPFFYVGMFIVPWLIRRDMAKKWNMSARLR